MTAARKRKTEPKPSRKVGRVRALATSVPKEYIDCRTITHAWKYDDVTMDGRKYVQWLVCRSCGARRTKVYSPEGKIVKGNYTYPPGYLIKGSLTPAERGRLNVLSLKQQLKKKEN